MKRFNSRAGLRAWCLSVLAVMLSVTSFASTSPPNKFDSTALDTKSVALSKQSTASAAGFDYSLATIYTLKQRKISEVALVPLYVIKPNLFGGDLKYDAFAGIRNDGSPIGGTGLVWHRQFDPHLSGEVGLVATTQNGKPIDAGVLVGIGLKF